MAQRKPYNPNTAYGRRKLREQYEQRRAEMTPEERRREGCSGGLILVAIALIVLVISYFLGCEGDAIKWMTR